MRLFQLSTKFGRVCTLVLPLVVSGPALAWKGGESSTQEREKAMDLTPNLENGKHLYSLCSNCHTKDGSGMIMGIGLRRMPGYYPKLAGQHSTVLIKQISDIRSGNRDNPIMYPFTLPKYIGGPQDIADVAGYISTLPVSKETDVGDGREPLLGQNLYKEHCTECHGDNGEGSSEDFYPRIQGQHYDYILRQMKWIRDGRRRNANEKMIRQIERFTFRDLRAVSDYVSRMQAKMSTPVASEQ